MWADGNKTQINNPHGDNVPVKKEIKQYVKKSVCPSCNPVPENFDWNESQKREVKTINYTDDKVPDISQQINHKGYLFP